MKNAVTPKHCRDAVTAVYDFFEQSGTGIKRGDWKTWKNAGIAHLHCSTASTDKFA